MINTKTLVFVVVCLCLQGVHSANNGPRQHTESVAGRLKRAVPHASAAAPRFQAAGATHHVSAEVAHAEAEAALAIIEAYDNQPIDTAEQRLRVKQLAEAHEAIRARQRARDRELRSVEFEHALKLQSLERQRDLVLQHVRTVANQLAQQQQQAEVGAASSSSPPEVASSSSTGVAAPPDASSSSTGVAAPPDASSSSTGVAAPPDASSSSTGVAAPPDASSSSTGVAAPPPDVSSSSTGVAAPPDASSSSTGVAVPPDASSSSTGVAAPPDASSSSTGVAVPPPDASSSTGVAAPPDASSSTGSVVPPPASSSTAAGGLTGATSGVTVDASSSTGVGTEENVTASSTARQRFVPGFIDHDPFAKGQVFESGSTGDIAWPSPIADESDAIDVMNTAQSSGGYFTPEVLPPVPETVAATAASSGAQWLPAEISATSINENAASVISWRWKQKLRSQRGGHVMAPSDDEGNVFSLLQTREQTKTTTQTDVDEFSAKHLAQEQKDLIAQLNQVDKTKPAWLQ